MPKSSALPRSKAQAAKRKASGSSSGAAGAVAAATAAAVPAIIDAADQHDGGPKRKLRRRDSDQAVKKILYDHFRCFSDEEMYLREVGGKTLYDRVRLDRERWRAGHIEMGMKYYNTLRMQYENPNSLQSRLKPTNPEDQADEELRECLGDLVESRNTQGFLDWCDTVAVVNNFNFVVVCRQLAGMTPNAKSIDRTVVSMAALKMVHRLSLHTVHPIPWAVMREFFDKVLVSSLKQHKAQLKPASFWWRANQECASLILPPDAVTRALACKTAWSEIATQVQQVYESSEVGRLLMEKAIRQVSVERVTTIIEEHVAKLNSLVGEPVMLATLALMRDDFLRDIKARCCDGVKPFDQPKDINCKYRGTCTMVQVSSPLDHYNIRVAAEIRGIAVKQGKVPAMWVEDSLVPDAPAVSIRIADEVLKQCKDFRDAMNDLLSHEEATGPNIKEAIKQKGSWLLSLDNRGRVDLAFWNSSIGENARARVQDGILACLPDEATPMTISQSLEKFDEMARGKLLVFAGVGLAAVFQTVHSFAKCLKASSAPPVDTAGDSPFMQLVRARLGCFLRIPDPNLVGKEAAQHKLKLLQNVHNKDPAKVSYSEVAILQCFAWLLAPEELKFLSGVGKALVSGASAGGEAAKVAKKGKKSLGPEDVQERVSNLSAR